jgi:membrane protease YdiL (CAAX protease family)
MALGLASNVGLIVAVGAWRARTRPGAWAHEAETFAISATGLMLGAVVSSVVLLAVACATARWLEGRIVRPLRLGPSRATAFGFAAAIFGMVGMSVSCGAASELARVRGSGVMDVIGHALQLISMRSLPWAIVTLGVLPGIAEETFFRGLVQTRMAALFGRWPGIVIASGAFGLIHGDIVQGGAAFVAGIFLGWVADRLGGIRPAMVAHAANNTLFVVAATQSSNVSASTEVRFVALIAGFAVCAGCALVLRSALAVSPEA